MNGYISFNNGYAQVANNAAGNGVGDFTVEIRMRRSAIPAENETLIDKSLYTAGPGYVIRIETDGTIDFYVRGGNGFERVRGTSSVCDGDWHDIACVRSGTSLKVFVDGVEEASATVSSSDLSNAVNLIIGKMYWDSATTWTFPFYGDIQWVAVWSAALSSGSQGQGETLTGSETNLILFFPMDEGSGTTLNDAAANGYDAALSGTYTWTPPTYTVITGTLKEKESDAGGSQYDFAVIKTDFTTPEFTIMEAAESAVDGAFAVDVDDDTTRHFELRLDPSGTYKPKIRDKVTGAEGSAAGTSFTEPAYSAGASSYSGQHLIADGSGANGFYVIAFYYPLRDITDFCYAGFVTCDTNGGWEFTNLNSGIYIFAILDPDGNYEPYVFEASVS